jgi:ribosomal protein S18 acetylase RimI-like enzyme
MGKFSAAVALKHRLDVRVTDTTLRMADLSDLSAVLAFWRIAAEDTDRQDTVEGLGRLIRRDPEALLLAEAGDRLVGTLIVGWDGWRLHLYRLAVHPEARRTGIARMLLGEADRRARVHGAQRMDAMVLDANDVGRKAWTAAGYHPQPQWSRWARAVR